MATINIRDKALVPLIEGTKADDIPMCASCDFVSTGGAFGEDDGTLSRACSECFCAVCALFDSPSREGALLECATCRGKKSLIKSEFDDDEQLFGVRRVHAACLKRRLQNLSSHLHEYRCSYCGEVLATTAAVPAGVSVPSEVTADKADPQSSSNRQHNFLSALLASDPSSMTFETLHFGALIALQRATSNRTSQGIDFRDHYLCPDAATRVRLSTPANTGIPCFVLPGINSARVAPPYSTLDLSTAFLDHVRKAQVEAVTNGTTPSFSLGSLLRPSVREIFERRDILTTSQWTEVKAPRQKRQRREDEKLCTGALFQCSIYQARRDSLEKRKRVNL